MTDERERDGLGRRQSRLLSRLIACACACAQAYFPDGRSGTTLTAAQFLLTGKYDTWATFASLPLDDQRRLSRLLGHRPNPLANDSAFREYASRNFFDKSVPGFRLHDGVEHVVAHHGLNPRDCIDQLLVEMDDIRTAQPSASLIAKPGEYTHTLRVPMAGRQNAPVLAYYTFEEHHAPPRDPQPVRLPTAPELAEVTLKIEGFLQLNAQLDEATGKVFRAETLTPFFEKMRTGQGDVVKDVLRLPAGPTRVLSAPTGSGKSVMLRSYASWAMQEGHSVALVVDTNANALKLTHAIEQDLEKWGVRARLGKDASQVVVPLMSPNSLMRELERSVKGSHDPDYVDWVFARIGYSCQLPACASVDEAVDTWVPGGEPCTKLTAVRPERGEPYRSMPAPKICPFRQGCGKFRLARQASSARIIVTTHANLYEGRMHIPLEADDGTVDEKVSVEKFLMTRAQVVLIDELDAFQSTVMDRSGRGLTLAWGDRGHDRPLLEVDTQVVSAFGRLPGALEERTRSNVSECRRLAETYTMHLARGDLSLSDQLPDEPGEKRSQHRGGRRWIVPQRWDGWLGKHLAAFLADDVAKVATDPGPPEDSGGAVLLEAVYDSEVASHLLPSHVREFARAVRSITTAVDVAGVLENARGELFEMLASWVPATKTRAAVIDRLVRRMFLVPLRGMLYSFVYDAPQLKLAGVPAAEEIAQALGGYEKWRAIPHGPLGRLVFAFTEDHNPKSPHETKLSAAAFGGDPHRYITSLGQITALAHSGHPRVVLGLSATAYMPGAHRHHIHTRPEFIVPDEGSEVVVDARAIPGLEGEMIRISGLTGKKRRDATRQLGGKLWSELSRELEALAAENAPGIQDAILLATTSYQSCRDLAEGMRAAGAPPGLIAVAVRPDADTEATAEPEAEDRPWIEIAGDQLEDFGGRAHARILIAPLKRAERSLNILTPGERRSRIGSIWLAVRPMSIVDDPDELLAHVGARALDDLRVHDQPWLELAKSKKTAGQYFDELLSSQRYFSALPRRAKKAIAAELIASIIQLVGRARRGGTPGRIRLVDYAFLDPRGNSDLPSLIRQLRTDWARSGELDTLLTTNGAALRAFFTFADNHSVTADSLDTAC
ncbi:DEAD/DEAH box helicase family protein [Streptomyces microflavus]|uniref:DEAD/DEAH box helicase family protein n=1 Tax=Streptomyces microflavus TaxID=1919 RepID=UPI0033B7BC9B